MYLFENINSEAFKLRAKSFLYSVVWLLTLTLNVDVGPAQAEPQDVNCASLPSIVFKLELHQRTIELAEQCFHEGDAFAHSYLQSLYLAHLTDQSEEMFSALRGPDDADSPESYMKALLLRMLSSGSKPTYSEYFYRKEYLRKALEGDVHSAKIFANYQDLGSNRSKDEPKAQLPEDMGEAHREAIEYFGDGCTQIRFPQELNDEFLTKYWQAPEYPQMLANHIDDNCGYAIDFVERNALKPEIVGDFFITMPRLVFERSQGYEDSLADLYEMTAKDASDELVPEVSHWLQKYKEHTVESPIDWCDQYFPGKTNLCYRVAFRDHFICMSALSMPSSYDVRHSAEYDLCRAGEIAKFKDSLLN
ncbi:MULTISPECIES: hypothetical protein [unclassified Thalassospira]|uniref:hypothetical protein n=1 Tax=unclassified Thalassospira TaxID=2648997 RepID=UPI001B2BA12E|nr:hypothetical protein [Thalassospira sp.]MBO6772953.1 hypothetical protein [Thalassospira sp.]